MQSLMLVCLSTCKRTPQLNSIHKSYLKSCVLRSNMVCVHNNPYYSTGNNQNKPLRDITPRHLGWNGWYEGPWSTCWTTSEWEFAALVAKIESQPQRQIWILLAGLPFGILAGTVLPGFPPLLPPPPLPPPPPPPLCITLGLSEVVLACRVGLVEGWGAHWQRLLATTTAAVTVLYKPLILTMILIGIRLLCKEGLHQMIKKKYYWCLHASCTWRALN